MATDRLSDRHQLPPIAADGALTRHPTDTEDDRLPVKDLVEAPLVIWDPRREAVVFLQERLNVFFGTTALQVAACKCSPRRPSPHRYDGSPGRRQLRPPHPAGG